MLSLFAPMTFWRLWNRTTTAARAATAGAARHHSIANGLLERAEARAGLSPHQAQELRQAARAYLSVVR